MAETLFVPCTRMHDLMRAFNDDHEHVDDGDFVFPEDVDIEEVELRAGVGNGDVALFHQYPDFTFDNLWRLARRKIVWISPDIFFEALVTSDDTREALNYVDFFEYQSLFSVRPATSFGYPLRVCSRSAGTDATTIACDYVFQLMTRSNTNWEFLEMIALASVSTLVLSRFLNNSRSSAGTIFFRQTDDLSDFSQDYLRVFEASAGPYHRLGLASETNTNWSQLQIVTVANFFQHCQCKISLYCREFPVPSLILDAVGGDCNIVELDLDIVPDTDGLVRVLAKNKSLVRLDFSDIRISDDSWTVLCQSIYLPKTDSTFCMPKLSAPSRF
jgi:hypothetical protein